MVISVWSSSYALPHPRGLPDFSALDSHFINGIENYVKNLKRTLKGPPPT